MFMDSPGLLRKVPFPFGGFLEVVAHMEDGPRPSAYAAELEVVAHMQPRPADNFGASVQPLLLVRMAPLGTRRGI